MKKLAISAFLAVALMGAAGAQAAPMKNEDPIKKECRAQNPKDAKAYQKCVSAKQASNPAAPGAVK